MARQPSAQEGTHEYVIMAVVWLNLVCVYLSLTDCEQDNFPKDPATEKIELMLAEGNPYWVHE